LLFPLCLSLLKHQEQLTTRLILKHLRRKGWYSSYIELLQESNLSLEHPLISELYDTLVINGDWDRVDSILLQIRDEGLMKQYTGTAKFTSIWKMLQSPKAKGKVPCARVGHAVCINKQEQIIYLHGGWNGSSFLDDLWRFRILENKWEQLFNELNGSVFGEPRCGHQMVFDHIEGHIYLFGKLPFNNPSSGKLLLGRKTDLVLQWEQNLRANWIRYHTRGCMRGTVEYLSQDTLVRILLMQCNLE
jgi:muskelin